MFVEDVPAAGRRAYAARRSCLRTDSLSAARATGAIGFSERKLHKPNTRLQETMNEVLYRFRSENPMAPVARVAENESVRKQERRAA